jgi:hypothetical protein
MRPLVASVATAAQISRRKVSKNNRMGRDLLRARVTMTVLAVDLERPEVDDALK